MEKKVVKKHKVKKVPERKWYLVDAQDKILGRLATRVASVLRGKEKPSFVPYMDKGDYVIIINAEKVKVTGKKTEQKIYYRHSTYPGGLKKRTYQEQMNRDPRKIILHAVKGMIPKNTLGRDICRKLFIYDNAQHKHQAQKPVELKI